LWAGIVGEPSPTKIAVARPDMISLRILEPLKHHLALEAALSSPQMQENITQLQQLAAKWFNQHMTRY
jgi:hypothetical protein